MTTITPRDKRMSVDVSDLVDQIRPYTPQANRKAFREAPLNTCDSNTPAQVFSSPLPPPNPRGKPTADEAAKVLLANDPFLNLQTPNPHPTEPEEVNDHPHSQVINISAPSAAFDNTEEQERVSASFRVRAPAAAMAFSPVLPRPINEALLPTEPLPSATPSPSSGPLSHSQGDIPTPVSAAKPPRPPVLRLQPLHSPSEQHSQSCASPAPSTPFASTIPLSYSAVKTPGAATLNYLGSTPASARQNSDPSSMVEFFRSRSAHVTSPIFSAKKKLDCEDLGSPELRINPLADSTEDVNAIPQGVHPEIVVRMDFSMGYGFDRAEDIDLSSRANRVPVLYAVVVRTTDLGGNIRPAYASLERDSDSAHTMLVETAKNSVRFVHVEDTYKSDGGEPENIVQEAVLTFWAAPDSFVQFGSAALLLTVTDENEISYETKIELHVVGTEPVIAVEAKGNHATPERKETTVTFEDQRSPSEEGITIWNRTFGGAPLLINAVVADSASGSFTIRDCDGNAQDCVPMMIPGGKSCTFTACFELRPNTTLRGHYYGCVLLKLATLMPSKGRHTSSDIDLHQFYDHVLNFEAHVAGVPTIDRLSTLEDPSSNNLEEMLYHHRYGNDYNADSRQQPYEYTSGQERISIDERPRDIQGEVHGVADDPENDIIAAAGALKRLSLVVSSETKELPEEFEKKPYMLCEYDLVEPPRWIPVDKEFVESGLDHEQLESCDTGVNERTNDPEGPDGFGNTPRLIEEDEALRHLGYSRESYEQWKQSLEDERTVPFNTAPFSDETGHHDQYPEISHAYRTSKAEAPEEQAPASETSRNVGDVYDEVSSQTAEQSVEDDSPNSYVPRPDERENPPISDFRTRLVGPDLVGAPYVRNQGTSDEGIDNVSGKEYEHPLTSLDIEKEAGAEKAPVLSLSTDVKLVGSASAAVNTTMVLANTASQEPSNGQQKLVGIPPANTKKPPLPSKMGASTATRQMISLYQNGSIAAKDVFSPKQEGMYLTENPVDGVHRKNKKNLKGIMESVGAAVDGLRLEQRFLKQYTKFDSTFNMSEDLSNRGSRHVSLSSIGSLATANPQQKASIRNFASKLTVSKRDDVRYRPKLRMPRKLLERGLLIAADSGSTKLTVCNGSLGTIRVDISIRQGLKLKGQVLIQPQFLALRPEQKAVIRLTRLTSEEAKVYILLSCSNLNGSQSLSCTYRLPVVIEPARNRVPTVQGFAVDRPTLTFYNPKSTARHCRVRVLNGTRRKVAYKVWIGKNKEHSAYHESAFSVLSHHKGTVEPQKCFSIIVVFDSLGQTEYFHEKLFISVGRKTDYIPMFGYGGASNIKFSRSDQGHLRAHNTGCRYGFLILSGPEIASAENATIRVVLAPEETRDFVPPYGSGTIIFTGDEIARTRLSQSLVLRERGNPDDNDEDGLFLGHFEGQEQAAEDEELFWEHENKHTLHYAGRLLDSNTRRYMFATDSENVVPYIDRSRDAELSWHASVDGSRFLHIENYDSKHELSFTVIGAEPTVGSIPPLGDAILAAFAENVQIFARGQCRELEAPSMR